MGRERYETWEVWFSDWRLWNSMFRWVLAQALLFSASVVATGNNVNKNVIMNNPPVAEFTPQR
jgi:hypothetical protein